jgi:hypothetical protein
MKQWYDNIFVAMCELGLVAGWVDCVWWWWAFYACSLAVVSRKEISGEHPVNVREKGTPTK